MAVTAGRRSEIDATIRRLVQFLFNEAYAGIEFCELSRYELDVGSNLPDVLADAAYQKQISSQGGENGERRQSHCEVQLSVGQCGSLL